MAVRALASYVVGLAGVLALCVAGPAVSESAATADSARQGPKVAAFVPRASDDDRLRAAWARWVKVRTPHYATRVMRACECPEQPIVRTEVRRGRLVSVRDVKQHSTLPWSQAKPMDRIFRLLRKGYRTADAISVRYNKRGVPLFLVIDWSELVADEETVLSVRARTGL